MKHLHPTFLFSPEGSGGAAATTTPEGGQGTPTADAAGANGGESANGQNSGDDKKFTQADIDRIVTDRLARAEEKSKKEQEKAKKEAELAQLAEKQEFQTLAQKRQEQILELEERAKELDPLKDKVKKYETALTAYRDALINGVPAEVRKLLDGLDIADQLTWLGENAGKFNGGKTPLPSTPNQNGSTALTPEEKRRQAYRPTF